MAFLTSSFTPFYNRVLERISLRKVYNLRSNAFAQTMTCARKLNLCSEICVILIFAQGVQFALNKVKVDRDGNTHTYTVMKNERITTLQLANLLNQIMHFNIICKTRASLQYRGNKQSQSQLTFPRSSPTRREVVIILYNTISSVERGRCSIASALDHNLGAPQ